MKRVKFLAFAAVLMMATACSESLEEAADATSSVKGDVEDAEAIVTDDGPIVLGDKLPNPFSLENMRKAIAEFQSRGLSKAELSTDIQPTHYYMRFKPKNVDEVDAVEADTTVFYYSFPLDREIVGGSTNYRDPELPDSVPSYMYCTMPVDHVLPNVEHEILEELYILEDVNVYDDVNDDDEDIETSLSKHSKASYWPELKNIALEQVGMEPETPDLSKSWKPRGRITYHDNSLFKTIPLEGAPVHTVRTFIGHQCCTDVNGEFSMPKVNCKHTFFIKWKRADFKIRRQTGLDAAELVIASNVKKKAINFSFSTIMGPEWGIASIFRAAHYYHYGNIDGLSRPGNNNLTIRACGNNDDKHGCAGRHFIASDVHIYNLDRKSAEIYGTTIHELTHIAHRHSVCANNSKFEDTSSDVKESWAVGVQNYLTAKVYSGYTRGYYDNEYTNVVSDILSKTTYGSEKSVASYTIVELEKTLRHARNWNEWKDYVKSDYPKKNEKYIDAIFDYWAAL
ncbi:MAG: hypothetical protein IKQ30_06845 [Bacteroidales bacterium]|nr:hypothetical protein [Bacteroidales bacterium]